MSCSSHICLSTYTLQEISNNKKSNVISIINYRKLDNSRTLKTYFGINRGNYNTRAKSFNQMDYNYLRNNFIPDSINYKSKKELITLERLKLQNKTYDEKRYNTLKKESENFMQFWSEKDIKKFGFNTDSLNEKEKNYKIFEYSISDPIFTEDNKKALFSVSISKKDSKSYEDFLIIMKKIKNKWILLEKTQSTILH